MKGESSPSTARLYLPINVMPFPHLISLCDYQSYTTVAAPIFPIRKHSRHWQIFKRFLGWTLGIWIGPVMVESTPLMPVCFLKKTVLLHDDWLKFLSENQKRTTVTTYMSNPLWAMMTYFVSLAFSWKPIIPFTSGIQINSKQNIKWNGFNDLSPAPHTRAANPCHQIWRDIIWYN